ncbi:MAG: DUF4834 family protein [Bacteroidota bacterium]
MFLKIISLGFLLYILYKFVFEFLVPVFKATRNLKKGFRDMQQQAQDNMNRQQTNATNSATSSSADSERKKQPIGDYIDFEEIK